MARQRQYWGTTQNTHHPNHESSAWHAITVTRSRSHAILLKQRVTKENEQPIPTLDAIWISRSQDPRPATLGGLRASLKLVDSERYGQKELTTYKEACQKLKNFHRNCGYTGTVLPLSTLSLQAACFQVSLWLLSWVFLAITLGLLFNLIAQTHDPHIGCIRLYMTHVMRLWDHFGVTVEVLNLKFHAACSWCC